MLLNSVKTRKPTVMSTGLGLDSKSAEIKVRLPIALPRLDHTTDSTPTFRAGPQEARRSLDGTAESSHSSCRQGHVEDGEVPFVYIL